MDDDDEDIFASSEDEDEKEKEISPPLHSSVVKKPRLQKLTSKNNDTSVIEKVSVSAENQLKSSSIVPERSAELPKKSKEKDIFDSDSGDEYDSEVDVKRTADDDAFIDKEDDNADLLAEYEEDPQHFDDERPENYKRKKDREETEEVEDSNPLSQTLKSMKRRRSDDLSEIHKTEIAQDLLHKMDRAAKADNQLYLEGKPAVHKLNMLKQVQKLAGVKSLQNTLLDFDILGALRTWIEPKDKSTLPGLTVRVAVYELLKRLPCEKDHLKRSGIGKTLVAIRKHDMETAANKRLLKEIIDKWCRPIFGKSADIRAADSTDRRSLLKSVLGNPAASGSGHKVLSQRILDHDLDLQDDDGEENSQFNAVANPQRRYQDQEIFNYLSTGPEASGESYDRVRVPRSSGFVFAVRPESKVDKSAARETALSGSKGNLLKKMKEMKGLNAKKNYRAVSADLTGRTKA